ncbi:hypothetical protein [Kibdelosporangium philippinense]
MKTHGYQPSRVDHAKFFKEPGLAETTRIVYASFNPRTPGVPATSAQ